MYPKLGYYGAMAGNGVPLLNADRSLNLENIEKQAKWDTVILDVYPVVHRPDILTALRQANPFIQLIQYVVMRWWKNPNPALGPAREDFAWRFYEICVEKTNGALYTMDDKPYENWINATNEDTCRQLASLITEMPNLWDGVFLDDFIPAWYGNPNLNFKRAGHETWEGFRVAWEAGHKFLAQQVKTAFHDKPCLYNYGPGHNENIYTGTMRENFPFQNTNETYPGWEANMVKTPWGMPGYLKEQYQEPHLSVLVSDPRGSMALSAQKLRYGLASAALDDGIHSFARAEMHPDWVVKHLDWWFPEYTFGVKQLGSGKGWLGRSLGEAYKLVTGVWTREFERGLVYVNPTTSVQRVETPLMRKYDGPAKKAWAIPPQDGLLLQRQ